MSVTRRKIISKRSLILLTTLLIISLPFAYFFLWRGSDADYSKAKSNISTLESISQVLPVSADSVDIAKASAARIADLNSSVDKYQTTLSELKASRAVAHDFTVQAAYQAGKAEIEGYAGYMKDLTTSLKAYRSAIAGCATLLAGLGNLETKSDFETTAADCKNTLKNNQTVPNKDINDEAYAPLKAQLEVLVGATEDFFTASDNSDTAGKDAAKASFKQALIDMKAVNSTVTLSLPSQPTNELKQLSDVLDKQRSVFLR